ncbi:hypothetical protein ACP4OV_021145 [Aristida adscensionis]
MEALRNTKLPVGFGFYPSDSELIDHYLRRKIQGQKIDDDLIPEVDIYKHEPWDLPAKCKLPFEDNKWHFFASRDRKYPTGSRSNRATIAGYWKSTGKDRAIKVKKRTVGTKKTLVFHEGRPPSGKRTEWIMHEYYIDEKECHASPEMKDAFVLCRVTKRDDWALENDNEVSNRNPHQQKLNDAATSVANVEEPQDAAASVICEEPNHVAAPVSAEHSNDVAMPANTSDTATPNADNELQAWLEGLLDPPFSPDLSLYEQHAESSNLPNPGSIAPKMEPDQSSPGQNDLDVTDYLLTEDIHNILYPGVDNFNDSIFPQLAEQAGFAFATDYSCSMNGMDQFNLPNNFEDGTWKEELQLQAEHNNPNLSNGIVDNGITIRRRNTTVSAANITPSAHRIKLQVGINRMVTSNSESINQTLKFTDNSGRLDRMTSFNSANDVTSLKKPGPALSKGHSNQGYFRGIKNAFRCSSAGFKVLTAVCVIGVAAVAYCMGTTTALSST